MTYPIGSGTSAWMALGDSTRRAIFERLLEQPQAVHTLANGFPVSRPAVSQHLKVLSDAGLVVARRAGKERIYQVDPNGIAALSAELQRFWDKTMAAYQAVVEQSAAESPKEQ